MPDTLQTPRTPHRRRGFTLIEVMVVVAIIVILAAIGLAIGAAVKRKAAEGATKTTLDSLRLAMNAYLQDHPDPGANWFTALTKGDPNIYKAISSLNGMPAEVDDGYGVMIRYMPAANGKPGYFYSYGPDGVAGNDDIIGNPVGP